MSSEQFITISKDQLLALFEAMNKGQGRDLQPIAKASSSASCFNLQNIGHENNISPIGGHLDQALCPTLMSPNPIEDRKRKQWKQDKLANAESRDWWFHNGSRNSHTPLSLPQEHWSGTPTPVIELSGPMTPSPYLATPCYRRYRTMSDPAEWEEKRRKIAEYQMALEAQKAEKEARLKDEREREKLLAAMLDRRMEEQQSKMRLEVETERRRQREREEETERRRQTVMAALEGVPPIKIKISGTDEMPPVASVPPTVKEGVYSSSKDASVQTDFDLLFKWLLSSEQFKQFSNFLHTSAETEKFSKTPPLPSCKPRRSRSSFGSSSRVTSSPPPSGRSLKARSVQPFRMSETRMVQPLSHVLIDREPNYRRHKLKASEDRLVRLRITDDQSEK
ncbi:hypothetical protein HDE_01495 [Halotydeus destructor]|nr:hypothetical protein HDE_01495 [Halotydeus destructor]